MKPVVKKNNEIMQDKSLCTNFIFLIISSLKLYYIYYKIIILYLNGEDNVVLIFIWAKRRTHIKLLN